MSAELTEQSLEDALNAIADNAAFANPSYLIVPPKMVWHAERLLWWLKWGANRRVYLRRRARRPAQ